MLLHVMRNNELLLRPSVVFAEVHNRLPRILIDINGQLELMSTCHVVHRWRVIQPRLSTFQLMGTCCTIQVIDLNLVAHLLGLRNVRNLARTVQRVRLAMIDFVHVAYVTVGVVSDLVMLVLNRAGRFD